MEKLELTITLSIAYTCRHIFRLFILLHSRENSDKFAGILKKQNDVCSRTYKLNGKSLLQIKMKLENVISTQLRMKGTARSLIRTSTDM